MLYQVTKYSPSAESLDEESFKRYEMIRKLSKDFTKEHTLALQMDKLLTEHLDLENSDFTPSSASPPKVKKQLPAKPTSTPVLKKVDTRELTEAFDSLFEAIKDQTPKLIQFKLPTFLSPVMQQPEINEFQQIVDDVLMGNNVILIGGAGTGKTYLAENLVAHQALGREHITINCSQWTSPTEIIGGQTMDGYQEGKLIEAWKTGKILVLDELPKIDPNTAGLLNDALAKTKIQSSVIFNARKESFVKHPDFGCIATGNVYPNKESMAYGANNKQDLSLLDRFSGSVYFIEKNPRIEKAILQNPMIWSICDKLRAAIEELKYEAQLSLRFMQNARDSYLLELSRSDSSTPKANEGKTFKSSMDSFLSTFTEIQQRNLKEKIMYTAYIEKYQYRSLPSQKLIVYA